MQETRFLFASDFTAFQSPKKSFPDNWLTTISIMNGIIAKEMLSKARAFNLAMSVISSDIDQPFTDRDALTQCIRDVTDVNFDLSPVGRRRLHGLTEILKQAMARDYSVIGGPDRALLIRAHSSINMGIEINPNNPGILRLANMASYSRNYRPNPLLLKIF